MLLKILKSKNLIHPPEWLVDNTHYMTIIGSTAYGISSDNSDEDIYGFCIPKKDMIFPHLRGEIIGFGKQSKMFGVWQEHHIKDKEKNKEYDCSIYSIVKFFQLCMECNPNLIDSLYTPSRCILHSTTIGNMVRDNRDLFINKGVWYKFKNYAYSQMHKMYIKKPKGEREEIVNSFGFDTKFAYHIVRLLNECEMILTEGTLDLERNREQLKEIRRGEWSIDDIKDYYDYKKIQLEKVYNESKIPNSPDVCKIKELLLNCLEHHFGSLDNIIHNAIHIEVKHELALREISEICRNAGIHP